MPNKRKRSTFKDFLEEEGILEEVKSTARRQALTILTLDLMEKQKITRAALAKKMKVSLSTLQRFLNPKDSSSTLRTLEAVAAALGQRVVLELTRKGT